MFHGVPSKGFAFLPYVLLQFYSPLARYQLILLLTVLLLISETQFHLIP